MRSSLAPTKSELYTAFQNGRPGNLDFIRVNPVENPGEAISSVLKRDLEGRIGSSPKKAHRAEFYSWLIRLPIGARIIRYGCDRYFNKLAETASATPDQNSEETALSILAGAVHVWQPRQEV